MEPLRDYGFSISFSASFATLHEMGHYVVARLLGYPAIIRASFNERDLTLMRTVIPVPVNPQDVPLILAGGTVFSLSILLLFLIAAKSSLRTYLMYLGFAAVDAAVNLLTPMGDALFPILDPDTSALLFLMRYVLLFALLMSLINDMRRHEEKDDWMEIVNSYYSGVG